MKRFFKLLFGIACLSLVWTAHLMAADHVFQIVTNASVLYHWPYDTNFEDLGFIGKPDNVVSNAPAPGSFSAPNIYGTYSYINLDNFSVVSQAHTYTFILGTITLNDAALANPGVALFKAAHFTGTEPYPGHGSMDLQLLLAFDGGLAPPADALGTNAFYFTSQVDFQSALLGGVAVATNASVSGFAILLSSNLFGTNLPTIPFDTNNSAADPTPTVMADYVNQVALPLARQMHPQSLLCGSFGLLTSGSSSGTASFPALATMGIFLAMEFAAPGSNSAPYLTLQPAGQEKRAGTQASFVVSAASATPLTYRWQKNYSNLTDSGNISGSTTTELTVNDLSAADAGVYSVIVSNSVGAIRSIPADLAVIFPPTIHAFVSEGDGQTPLAGLIEGKDGNFYGTTSAGGVHGVGTTFQLIPNGTPGTFTILHSFSGDDGSLPGAELTQTTDGNLYDAASSGGANDSGTIFNMTTDGAVLVLFSFDFGDGSNPQAGLIQGKDGNLYGTTTSGGTNFPFAGTIFRITTNGALTTLHYFKGGNDGFGPAARLLEVTDGSFYGTTSFGGTNDFGTIFRISTNGVFTALFSFAVSNGSTPLAGLVQGNDGDFYGTTSAGGEHDFGTVFRMTPAGTLDTLYSFGANQDAFGNPLDGASPYARLIQGADGSFYGTTAWGGADTNVEGSSFISGYGTIFKIATNGAFSTLLSFHGTNGASPQAELAQGTDGNLYGTTSAGGPSDLGTVFRFDLAPALQVVTKTNGAIKLTWSTVLGLVYQLQFRTNLVQTNWTNLGGVLTATSNTLSALDAIGPDLQRFYRVILLP